MTLIGCVFNWSDPVYFTPGAALAERLRREGFEHLEDARMRWDAAERCLVVTAPDGREVRVR